MTHPLVQQYDQVLPTLDCVFGQLDRSLKEAVALLSGLSLPAGALTPYLEQWKTGVAELGRARTDLTNLGPSVQAMCLHLRTLREAGQGWQDLASSRAYPLAESLSRVSLDAGSRFAWSSAAVGLYWHHVDGHHDTAAALARFQDDLGLSLITLADAIEKQATDLGWAIARYVASMIHLLGGGVGMAVAIGAVIGARGGAPGAIVGGIVGGIVSLVGAVINLIFAIRDWLATTTIIADAGAAELARLQQEIRALTTEAWPVPHDFGDGTDYQED